VNVSCDQVLTFYCWCRSVRDKGSWPWGLPAALAYGYMAAAWGGYTFVLNLVGLHACLLGAQTIELSPDGNVRFFDPSPLLKAYGLFYGVGTALAVQLPVVGWAPLRSLEQLMPLAVLAGVVLLKVRSSANIQNKTKSAEFGAPLACLAVAVAVAYRSAPLAGELAVAPPPAETRKHGQAGGVPGQARPRGRRRGGRRACVRRAGGVPRAAQFARAGAVREAHENREPTGRQRGRAPVYAPRDVSRGGRGHW